MHRVHRPLGGPLPWCVGYLSMHRACDLDQIAVDQSWYGASWRMCQDTGWCAGTCSESASKHLQCPWSFVVASNMYADIIDCRKQIMFHFCYATHAAK